MINYPTVLGRVENENEETRQNQNGVDDESEKCWAFQPNFWLPLSTYLKIVIRKTCVQSGQKADCFSAISARKNPVELCLAAKQEKNLLYIPSPPYFERLLGRLIGWGGGVLFLGIKKTSAIFLSDRLSSITGFLTISFWYSMWNIYIYIYIISEMVY